MYNAHMPSIGVFQFSSVPRTHIIHIVDELKKTRITDHLVRVTCCGSSWRRSVPRISPDGNEPPTRLRPPRGYCIYIARRLNKHRLRFTYLHSIQSYVLTFRLDSFSHNRPVATRTSSQPGRTLAA
jgi:hypothetical protein